MSNSQRVTLTHAGPKNGNARNIVAWEEEHDLSQFTSKVEPRWDSKQMAELLPKLADYAGMYSYDITQLDLMPRCKLAEKLLDDDRDGLFWQCGRHNVPPRTGRMLWKKYNE